MILGGAFEQEGSGGGAGGATQYVRENYESFKGTNLTVLKGMHQFIITCLVLFFIYSRFDVGFKRNASVYNHLPGVVFYL